MRCTTAAPARSKTSRTSGWVIVYLHTADGQALAFRVGEVIPHPDGRLVLARRPGAGVVWLGGRSRWLLSGILRIEGEDDEPALR